MSKALSDRGLAITSWLLIGSGLTVFAIALTSMVRALWLRERNAQKMSEGTRISLVLKCMLPWAPFFRVVDMLNSTISDGFYVLLDSAWKTQSWLEILLSSLPGYILIATYLLLVLFWAWLFQQTTSSSTSSLPATTGDDRGFYRSVVALWLMLFAGEIAVWLLLLMLMAALPNVQGDIHKGEAVYASCLSIAVAGLFAVWGVILFRRVKAAATRSDRSRLIANKIFWLTVICTILFLARTIIILLSTFVFTDGGLVEYVLTIFWTFGCEFLPTLLIIIILHWSLSPIDTRKKEAMPINAPPLRNRSALSVSILS